MISNFIEQISHFFAENRALSYLLLVSMVSFGLIAFWLMPKQYNPEIVRPAFVVSFAYEGATTAEAVDRVVYELVEKIQVVPGVEDILTEVKGGTTITSTIIFEVGHDATKAKTDLATELAGHSYLASGAVTPASILEINPETIPVLQVVLSSPTRTTGEVREAVLALRNQLLRVPGVSELTVVGGEGRAVMVTLDPVKLAAAEIPLETVLSVLSSAGVRLDAPGYENETYTMAATLEARPSSVAEVGELALTPSVRLRDVALVYEGVTPDRSYTLHVTPGNKAAEVVVLAVSKVEGASAPVVTAAVREVLQSTVPEDVSYLVVSDDGVVASAEITGLTQNLISSIIIVAIILFLFLSARAALVVLITVPLTFLVVIGIGWLFGETINRITLFALILSLGLLVDASIVVVDNIYMHLREAYRQGRTVSKAKVAAEAVREVGVGLVLSALTSVIVFVPMFYITGMMGPYMGPIAFFVPLALIVSLIIAIVLAPFLAAIILPYEERTNRLAAFFQSGMERLTAYYVRVLHRVVYTARVRQLLLFGALGAFVFSLLFPLSGLVHFQMLPKADRDQFYLYIDAPTGTARAATKHFTEAVVAASLEHEAVVSAQLYVAGAPVADFNGLFKGSPMRTGVDQATVRINLTPSSDRSESSTEIATAVRANLVETLGAQSQYVRLMEDPPGPPVRATLVAKVNANDSAVQAKAVSALRAFMVTVPGVVDDYVSDETVVEELRYELDREKVSASGLSIPQLATWFSLLHSPVVAGEYLAAESGERVPLLLSLPYEYTSNPRGGESLPIVNPSGETVPFSSFTKTTYGVNEAPVYLEGAAALSYLTAEVEGRSIVYVMIDVISSLVAGDVEGYKVTKWNLFGLTLEAPQGDLVTISWGGEWEMTLENFRDLGLAMLAALFLIYAILVAQYGSFSTPGFILVTVPLGLVGILLGFFVLDVGFGIYLTATALIGFIALIGIVVNNAIIYLEYVDQAEAEGTPFRDALIAAGAVRLRPIVLTSLTTVLGSLTIASDPVWSGLAWSIIFGLSLSTVLTLIVLPALLVSFSSRACQSEAVVE